MSPADAAGLRPGAAVRIVGRGLYGGRLVDSAFVTEPVPCGTSGTYRGRWSGASWAASDGAWFHVVVADSGRTWDVPVQHSMIEEVG